MFSIVIPLYNKEKQIANTIKSVQSQTFQDYEIIIVNDGSTDNSVEIVKQIDDKRIKLINQPNGGVSSARNTGIKNASFEYIAFLDADDEWMEDYLGTIFNMINQYPECDVFATNYKILDTNKNERVPVNINLAKFSKTLDNQCGILDDYFDFASMTAPPLWTSAIICTKEAIENIGSFPIGIRAGEDLITWAKLAQKFKICFNKNIKAIYKIDIETFEPGRLVDINDLVGNEFINLLDNEIDSKESLKRYVSLWFKMRASTFLRHNLKFKALKEIFKSLKYNLKNYRLYLYLVILIIPRYFYKYIFK